MYLSWFADIKISIKLIASFSCGKFSQFTGDAVELAKDEMAKDEIAKDEMAKDEMAKDLSF